MEKLTLEHIAPYLPYGLKVQSTLAATFGDIVDVIGAVNETLQLDGSRYREDTSNFEAVLRPMDLTKPIIVDGKEIIPIVELAKIFDPFHQWIIKDNKCVSSQCSFYLWDKDFVLKDHYAKDVLVCTRQLALFQWLFKNKFDVFGLIEQNLAIDVNTLNTNPYN